MTPENAESLESFKVCNIFIIRMLEQNKDKCTINVLNSNMGV
jgi:hypothetical protein